MNRATDAQRGRRGQAARLVMACAVLAVWAALFPTAAPCALSNSNPEIAILNSSDNASYHDAIACFGAAGPSGAIYTQYDLQGDLELGKKLARKIRASDAALVVAVGLKAALAAKLELVDTPVVYMMILDPLKHQLVAPNMAGTMLEVPMDRQLKLIKAFLPAARRLGVLYDPKQSLAKIKDAEQQATAAGLELKRFPVESDRDIPSQLRALMASSDALWLLPDSTVLTNDSVHFLLQSTLAQHVPVIGFSPEFTRLGALLGISVSYGEVGRETGQLARRLLNGDRVGSQKPIPVERLKVSVNMKTVRFLGLSVPPDLQGLIDETY
jgi:putative tryptophan/tyrosine transport system substrate-binding protein